ncbi:MAG: hypothetical protein ABL911_11435 [Gallionella sp.]
MKHVFECAAAQKKYWVMLPEYGYAVVEYPQHPDIFSFDRGNEADVIQELIDKINGANQLHGKKLCIDITGFMRPHILFLVQYLQTINIMSFDMIYTEPAQYGRKEDTKFSHDVYQVRQVAGFEGIHIDETANDILVVGVGYDDELISRVVNEKDGAKLYQLRSLPSLSADMYQESILRLDKTPLADQPDMADRVFFASANDPFVVATELSDKLQELRARKSVDNIYLSPLATKPQALGFALFYIMELRNHPASIIFPFSTSYSRETSAGVGRTWCYEIRLADVASI